MCFHLVQSANGSFVGLVVSGTLIHVYIYLYVYIHIYIYIRSKCIRYYDLSPLFVNFYALGFTCS